MRYMELRSSAQFLPGKMKPSQKSQPANDVYLKHNCTGNTKKVLTPAL